MSHVCCAATTHLMCSELRITRFIWKPSRTDEAAEHITTQNFDIPGSRDSGTLMRDALFASLSVPYSEHAFHGLVNEVRVFSKTLHNGLICVSIRSPAWDRVEQLAEQTVLEDFNNTGTSHFAFVVDASGVCSSLALSALDPAVEALGAWLVEYTG
jgi:hypothetical protein